MERKVPTRTSEEVKRYLSQIQKKLQAEGFKTFWEKDGTIAVWRGFKSLGNIGEHGEFYCKSGDLLNPVSKMQIEKVMQAIEEVNIQQQQQIPVEIPDQTICEMTLE